MKETENPGRVAAVSETSHHDVPMAEAPCVLSVTVPPAREAGPASPPPVRAPRPYKRGELKTDLAIQRHELMREVIRLKNELAAAKEDTRRVLDLLRDSEAAATSRISRLNAMVGALTNENAALTTDRNAAEALAVERGKQINDLKTALSAARSRCPWWRRRGTPSA